MPLTPMPLNRRHGSGRHSRAERFTAKFFTERLNDLRGLSGQI
jgi:hypothetical protein